MVCVAPADEVFLESYVVAGKGLHVALQLLRAGHCRGGGARLIAAAALHRQKLQELCAALYTATMRH